MRQTSQKNYYDNAPQYLQTNTTLNAPYIKSETEVHVGNSAYAVAFQIPYNFDSTVGKRNSLREKKFNIMVNLKINRDNHNFFKKL